MSSDKKIPKKRGRKPKNVDVKIEGEKISIEENLIIQLKKTYVDNYNIESFDDKKNVNTSVLNENKSEICWNCCHPFNNYVHGIPMKYNNGVFYVYGDFCSLECGCRYAHDVLIDYNFEELYSLINLYSNILFDKKEKIEMAPNKLLLKIFGGNLTIDEYRSKNKINYEVRIPPILPINHSINQYELNITKNKDYLKLYRKNPIKTDKKNITKSMNLIIDKQENETAE